MNKAMATLAEMLGIEHSKMPREKMAEAVCEAAITRIGGDAAQLNNLAENIAHYQNQLDHVCEPGCTPADADNLRKANHALAEENHALKERLSHSDNMIFEASSGSDAMSARLHDIQEENEKLIVQNKRLREIALAYYVNGVCLLDVRNILSESLDDSLNALRIEFQAEILLEQSELYWKKAAGPSPGWITADTVAKQLRRRAEELNNDRS